MVSREDQGLRFNIYHFIGITGLSENTINMAEDIFEQCASELHNYYVYEMRLPNYAPRLAKLTKIVSAAEVCIQIPCA